MSSWDGSLMLIVPIVETVPWAADLIQFNKNHILKVTEQTVKLARLTAPQIQCFSCPAII